MKFYGSDNTIQVWSEVLEAQVMTSDEEIVMGLVMSF